MMASYKRKPKKVRRRRGKRNVLARMRRNGLVEVLYPLEKDETMAQFRARFYQERPR